MSHTRDDTTGQYVQVVADETFLDALRALGEPGTADVAEYVECPRTTAYDRLRALRENGQVQQRTVGYTALWSLSDEQENDNGGETA